MTADGEAGGVFGRRCPPRKRAEAAGPGYDQVSHAVVRRRATFMVRVNGHRFLLRDSVWNEPGGERFHRENRSGGLWPGVRRGRRAKGPAVAGDTRHVIAALRLQTKGVALSSGRRTG